MSVWLCVRLLERSRREPAKRNAETAYTAGRTGLRPNDGRSHHPYRRNECNSELCRAPIGYPFGSPLLIILLKLAALASQNRNIQFMTLYLQQVFPSVKGKRVLLVLCCTVHTECFVAQSYTVL